MAVPSSPSEENIEVDTLISHSSDIQQEIQHNLQAIAIKALSVFLITQNELTNVTDRTLLKTTAALEFMNLVISRVRVDYRKFKVFIDILDKEPVYKDLVARLSKYLI